MLYGDWRTGLTRDEIAEIEHAMWVQSYCLHTISNGLRESLREVEEYMQTEAGRKILWEKCIGQLEKKN